MAKNVLIIGCGNVGTALAEIEVNAGNRVEIIELERLAPTSIEYDVAHVAIPYSDAFLGIVLNYLRDYLPKLVIIHSSIPLQVMKSLKTATGLMIVHSPVQLPESSDADRIIRNKLSSQTLVFADTQSDLNYAKIHLDDLLIYNVGVKLNRKDYEDDVAPVCKQELPEKYRCRDVVGDIEKNLRDIQSRTPYRRGNR